MYAPLVRGSRCYALVMISVMFEIVIESNYTWRLQSDDWMLR